jgi:tetratricopeptide (TPR) repeat protein
MTVNDNTKRIIFAVLVAILLLSIILPLVVARFEEQKAALSADEMKALWWAGKIIFFTSIPLMVFLVALFFYEDWLRKRIDTIELAHRMRIIVSIIFWLTIILLVLIEIRFVIILYRGSDHPISTSIRFLLLSLCFGYLLLYSWKSMLYFRNRPLCNIVADGLLYQSEKFLNARDFDKAYDALVKACEVVPDKIEPWCRLADFCELIRNDKAEADKYISKAGELITTNKANSVSERACYLNYLGSILYEREEYEKGLEYIKQSIDIEPRPGRISSYEKKLSEWREKQKGQSNNAG